MTRILTIGNPVANGPEATLQLSAAPASIQGTKVGFRVAWDSFDVFMREMATILREEYGVAEIKWWHQGDIQQQEQSRAKDAAAFAQQLDEFADGIDWAIMGLAA